VLLLFPVQRRTLGLRDVKKNTPDHTAETIDLYPTAKSEEINNENLLLKL
jgi:hypothetical protein